MKKVKGAMTVHGLGTKPFEFFVPDNAGPKSIESKAHAVCNYSIEYEVEEGYDEYIGGQNV